MRYTDLSGQVFGRLTVIERCGTRIKPSGKKTAQWRCRCECGAEAIVTTSDLKSGNTSSCGCLRKDLMRAKLTTHGMTNTRLHNVWVNIVQRCTNPNNTKYKDYGGRGIKLCEEWRSFENFHAWAMANGYDSNAPRGKCTIDRINNNGNYEPSNCRWVDTKTQVHNSRRYIKELTNA